MGPLERNLVGRQSPHKIHSTQASSLQPGHKLHRPESSDSRVAHRPARPRTQAVSAPRRIQVRLKPVTRAVQAAPTAKRPTGAGVPTGHGRTTPPSRGSCRPRARTLISTSYRLRGLAPSGHRTPGPGTEPPGASSLDRAHPVLLQSLALEGLPGLRPSAYREAPPTKRPQPCVTPPWVLCSHRPLTHAPGSLRPGRHRPLCSPGRWGRTLCSPRWWVSRAFHSPFPAGATLSPTTPGTSAGAAGQSYS